VVAGLCVGAADVGAIVVGGAVVGGAVGRAVVGVVVGAAVVGGGVGFCAPTGATATTVPMRTAPAMTVAPSERRPNRFFKVFNRGSSPGARGS